MAIKGNAFFDAKGQFFKTPEQATMSDLSAMLGQIGEGDSLAPGIAFMMMERRADIEKIFVEHDAMIGELAAGKGEADLAADNVTKLSDVKLPKSG